MKKALKVWKEGYLARLIVENPANMDNVFNAMFEGVYFVDHDRNIQKWSSGAFDLTGYTADELLQRCCADNILVHVDENGRELCKSGCPLQQTLQDAKPRQATIYLRHKLGYRVPVVVRTVPIRDSSGETIGAVETFREIGNADHWRSRTAELERLAFIDPVTGIPNRRFLETQLKLLLGMRQSDSEPFAMCMLDIDHFKSANDAHGHEFGDLVLQTMAQSLLNSLRVSDVLGRWGGDEFVLLLPKTGLGRAAQVAERSRLLIAESGTPTGNGFLKMTVSIGGVVVTPTEDRARLIRRVDEQLYAAKAQGRNRCCVA